MSEKSEVGIIGQLYEDRKTGKRGVLESRNDKYKTLMLADENGDAFTISNSTFRSNWRKAKVEDNNSSTDVVESDVSTASSEDDVNVSGPSYVSAEDTGDDVDEPTISITDDEAIEQLVSHIRPHRDVSTINDGGIFEIKVGNIVIFRMKSIGENMFKASMLPEMFSLSSLRDYVKPGTFKVSSDDADNLGVSIITKPTSFREIISILETAVLDINLYGYIIEEDN